MESATGTTQRINAAVSLEFANTPLTMTTTETTSTSDQMQPHLLSFQSPTNASMMNNNNNNITATTTSSSNDMPHPLFSEDGDPPDEVMSYFEHWASPTEVLQLRSMCTDLVSKYKSEAAKLRQEIGEMKRGRDMLLREVQETRNLRELYLKGSEESEKVRRERSQWAEERELLRLQLQRAVVENQRLHQALGRSRSPRLQSHGWVFAAPISGGGFVSSAPPTTGSTMSTPSLTSSSAAQQTHRIRGAHHHHHHHRQHSQPSHHHHRQPQQHHHQQQTVDVEYGGGGSTSVGDEYGHSTICSTSESEGTMREQLRLMEELHRCVTEYAELDGRFQFSQTLWEITEMRREQHTMLLVSENEKLKGKLHHWKAAAEDASSRLDAVSAQLRDCQNDLEDAQRALQVAHVERQTSLEAEHRAAQEATALLKAQHAEELEQAKQQLQIALDDAVRTRETLQKALDMTRRQAEAQREQLLADVEVAEHRCRDATKAHQEALASLMEKEAVHEQQHGQLKYQLLSLQSAQQRCIKEKTEQAEMLCALQDRHAQLEVQLCDTEEKLGVVDGRLSAALQKLRQCSDLEGELGLMRARAESAEAEMQAQQSYYSEQLRLHQTALTELQKQRDDEVLRLGRTIERLQRRCEAGRIRLAAAVTKSTGPNSAAVLTKGCDGQAQTQQLQCDEEVVEGRVRDGVQGSLRPDAVILLQQSAAIAATLARTIHRGGPYAA